MQARVARERQIVGRLEQKRRNARQEATLKRRRTLAKASEEREQQAESREEAREELRAKAGRQMGRRSRRTEPPTLTLIETPVDDLVRPQTEQAPGWAVPSLPCALTCVPFAPPAAASIKRGALAATRPFQQWASRIPFACADAAMRRAHGRHIPRKL